MSTTSWLDSNYYELRKQGYRIVYFEGPKQDDGLAVKCSLQLHSEKISDSVFDVYCSVAYDIAKDPNELGRSLMENIVSFFYPQNGVWKPNETQESNITVKTSQGIETNGSGKTTWLPKPLLALNHSTYETRLTEIEHNVRVYDKFACWYIDRKYFQHQGKLEPYHSDNAKPALLQYPHVSHESLAAVAYLGRLESCATQPEFEVSVDLGCMYLDASNHPERIVERMEKNVLLNQAIEF